jgi:hypothetical protein
VSTTQQYLSGAKLSGLLLRVPCDRRRVEAELAKVGRLRLAPEPGAPRELHPVHVELWSIHDGALRVGAMDQHRIAQNFGAAWGRAVGGLWGAALAPFGGPRYAPDLPARVAEWYALAVSRATAATVGTYRELIVSVPDVVVADDEPEERHSWVAGMVTDSALARWSDAAFGFGYQKIQGRLERDPRGSWSVSSRDGRTLVSVVRHAGAKQSTAIDLRRIEAAMQQPLLGSPRPGRLARSRLRRSLSQPGVHLAPVAVSLEAAPLFLGGLLPERQALVPYPDEDLWGAMEFTDLEAWVSYPDRA